MEIEAFPTEKPEKSYAPSEDELDGLRGLAEVVLPSAGIEKIRFLFRGGGRLALDGLRILNLHGNGIRDADLLYVADAVARGGPAGAPLRLEVLNLSANELTSTASLAPIDGRAASLRVVDLSSNLISELVCLSAILQVRILRLGFNRITEFALGGLAELGEPGGCLEQLDLRGNEIASASDATFLVHFHSLRHLWMQESGGRHANPCCSNSTSDYADLRAACTAEGVILDEIRAKTLNPSFPAGGIQEQPNLLGHVKRLRSPAAVARDVSVGSENGEDVNGWGSAFALHRIAVMGTAERAVVALEREICAIESCAISLLDTSTAALERASMGDARGPLSTLRCEQAMQCESTAGSHTTIPAMLERLLGALKRADESRSRRKMARRRNVSVATFLPGALALLARMSSAAHSTIDCASAQDSRALAVAHAAFQVSAAANEARTYAVYLSTLCIILNDGPRAVRKLLDFHVVSASVEASVLVSALAIRCRSAAMTHNLSERTVHARRLAQALAVSLQRETDMQQTLKKVLGSLDKLRKWAKCRTEDMEKLNRVTYGICAASRRRSEKVLEAIPRVIVIAENSEALVTHCQSLPVGPQDLGGNSSELVREGRSRFISDIFSAQIAVEKRLASVVAESRASLGTLKLVALALHNDAKNKERSRDIAVAAQISLMDKINALERREVTMTESFRQIEEDVQKLKRCYSKREEFNAKLSSTY